MLRSTSTGRRFFFTVVLLLGSVTLRAQNSNDINAGIQFDFSQSGARGLGMGGAFVAVADDATAVYNNPAGLTVFTRPEFSAEVRHWRWKSVIPDGGHAFGQASNIGVDTIAGVVYKSFTGNGTGLSFGSFVYPVRKWRFGAFRRELARYEVRRQLQGTFFNCSGGYRDDGPARSPFCEPHARQDGIDRIFPKKQWIALDINSIGGSIAYEMATNLSVGLGVQVASFEINATNRVFSVRGDKKFQPPSFSDPENLELMSVQQGDDRTWAFNTGLLWNLDERWSVGAAFQQGPNFEFGAETITGAQNVNGAGVVVARQTANPFKVPDHYALGLAFRPNPNAGNGFWLVSIEYDRVNFSQLIEDFREVATPAGNPEGAAVTERLTIDDANQIRAGVEYAINLSSGPARPRALAVRGGLAHDPQHQTYFQADDLHTGLPAPRWALMFQRGEDDVHVSAGLGVVFGRLQFDAAANLADLGNTFVLSTVFGF